jgi:hypothetical protein
MLARDMCVAGLSIKVGRDMARLKVLGWAGICR